MTRQTDHELELVVEAGDRGRLLIGMCAASNGEELVTVASQYRGRDGEWKLRHLGLELRPDDVRELAPMLLEMADYVLSDRR